MKRILIVDDDPSLNECMVEMLEALGYEAKGVLSGADCLALLNTGSYRPDIILLDIMMEPMDGWETLRGIRGIPALASTPVVMVTGKVPTAGELGEFLPMINGYHIKPFAMQVLKAEIERTISSTRRRDEILDRAQGSAEDLTAIKEFFNLHSSVRILEHLSATVGDAVVDQAALDRDRLRLKELSGQLPSPGVV